MNIQNLTAGMTIKNYKALCEVLEIKSTTGKSKTLQLKELERHVKYSKEGNKFIIDQIYTNAIEKIDNRGGNNKVFIDDFKALMLYMMKNNKSQELLLSKSALYKVSNLVNENYLEARKNIPKLADIVNLPEQAIYEFYDYNSTKIRQTADRNLKKMRSEALLIFEDVHAVAVNEVTIAVNEFNTPICNDTGALVYETRLTHRQANKDENSIILKFEKEVMEEMNFSNLQNVFLSGRWKTFKSEVEKRLKRANTNIKYYYGAYRITWNNDNVNKEYNKYCKGIDIQDVKLNLNSNMKNSILRANKNRHTKAKNFSGFGDAVTEKIKYQRFEGYTKEQEQLTFMLIDATAQSVVHKLNEPIKDYKKLSKLNDKCNDEQAQFNEAIPF